MGGKRKRTHRGRRPVVWVLAALTGVVIVLVPLGLRDAPAPPVGCGTCEGAVAIQPVRVATPRYLNESYVAPRSPKPTALGHLSVPRLRIDAVVVGVGWDHDAMSVPNDPATLGWFIPSARLDDLAGASLIAGHVSDARDRPGPLARLVEVHVGDVVQWRAADADVTRFHVTSIGRYPRVSGLPPALFKVDGPHVLRLVTCANRKAGPHGIHYADNLVVTAVAE